MIHTCISPTGKWASSSFNSSIIRSCNFLLIMLFALWIFSTGVVPCATAADTIVDTNPVISLSSDKENRSTPNLTVIPAGAGILFTSDSPYAPVEEDNPDEINATALAEAENETYAYNLVDKGIGCYNAGDIACASAAFEAAHDILPGDTNILYVQAQFFTLQKRYDEALKKIDTGISLDPEEAQLWYQKGKILNNMGRFFESGYSFDRAEELEPELEFPVTNRFPVNVIIKNSTFIILVIGFCVLGFVFYFKEIRL